MTDHNSFKCNYINHKSIDSNSNELNYCNNCDILICSQCLSEHNRKKENLNHKTELLNSILESIGKKKKELEEQPYMNDKSILNLKSNENDNFMNNKTEEFKALCNELNNFYRNQYSEYWINFLELEKLKENFKKKVKKNPILLLRDTPQDLDNINKIYEDLVQKEKNINYLFNATSKLLNEDDNLNNIPNFKYEKVDNNSFTIQSVVKPNFQLFKRIAVPHIEKDGNQNKENNNDINNKKGVTDLNSNLTENKNKNEITNKTISAKRPMFAIYHSTNINNKNLPQNFNKIINKNNFEEKNIKDKEIQEDKNNNEKKNYNNNNNNINKYNSNKNIMYNNNINNNLNMKKIQDENKNIINKKGNYLNKYSNLSNEMLLSMKTKRDNIKDQFLFNNNMSKYNNKKPKLQNSNLNKYYPNNIFMVSNSALISNYEEKKNNNDTSNVKYSLKELIPTLKKDVFIYKKNNINFEKKIYSPKKQRYHFYQNSGLLKHSKSPNRDKYDQNGIRPNHLNKNEMNQKSLEANNINKKNNDLNESKYLFGISTYDERVEKRLVVFELKSKLKIYINNIKSSDIIHAKEFLHSQKFPYPHCRLININNKAFVVGGNKQDDFNDIGNDYCFKIYYQRDKEDSILGRVICSPMKFTNYKHRSHCLLYSNYYKTIFALSGHNQKKCEYAKINEEECITEWEELIPLREPREDCLGFLFNEKYIFLIGGNPYNKNNSYDMFDISSLYENRRPMWKHYIIQYNYINRNLFDSKGSGVIEYKKNIYILGGYNISKEISSWKISFSIFMDDITISKIESFQMNSSHKNCSGFSFLGEQRYTNFGDYYYNIAYGGKCKYIHKTKLDNKD